jgi:prepilin peptidase CpaA
VRRSEGNNIQAGSRTTVTDPTMLHSMVLFAAAMALLFAAAHDVAVRTVPNQVSLIVALSGLGLNAFDGQLLPALFRGGLVFAVAWYCWRRGWIGGGDVKLLTACVLLVPPASVPELMLSTATAGGLLALCYLALARLLRGNVTSLSAGPGSAGSGQVGSVRRHNLLRRVWRAEQRRIHRRLSLPYSCAITAGVLLTLYVPLG